MEAASRGGAEVKPTSPDEWERAVFAEGLPVPALVVFDLDYTLWPFYVDSVDPPFARHDTGVYDSSGSRMDLFPHVPSILAAFHKHGVRLGIASRTSATLDARELLRLIHIPVPHMEERSGGIHQPMRALFHKDLVQIYPSDKQKHFGALTAASGVDYTHCLFFDDEGRNIRSVGDLGVTCRLIRSEGTTWEAVAAGVAAWRAAAGSSAKLKRSSGVPPSLGTLPASSRGSGAGGGSGGGSSSGGSSSAVSQPRSHDLRTFFPSSISTGPPGTEDMSVASGKSGKMTLRFG